MFASEKTQSGIFLLPGVDNLKEGKEEYVSRYINPIPIIKTKILVKNSLLKFFLLIKLDIKNILIQKG